MKNTGVLPGEYPLYGPGYSSPPSTSEGFSWSKFFSLKRYCTRSPGGVRHHARKAAAAAESTAFGSINPRPSLLARPRRSLSTLYGQFLRNRNRDVLSDGRLDNTRQTELDHMIVGHHLDFLRIPAHNVYNSFPPQYPAKEVELTKKVVAFATTLLLMALAVD